MTTFKEYLILEARKNPTLNPKVNTLDQLKAIAQKYGIEGVFVRFVDTPKLGHNIHFEFSTPLGISAYPIIHVLNKNTKVEWAADKPYMVIFKTLPGAKIWDLSGDVSMVASRILESMKKVLSINTPLATKLFRKPEEFSSNKQLWYFMYEHIQNKIGASVDSGKKPSVLARQILMGAGFDGVYDPGFGIIHSNEKTQAVFFNPRVLKQIGLVENKRNISIPNLLSSPEKLFNWYLSLGTDDTILNVFSDNTTINSTKQLQIIANLGNYVLKKLSGKALRRVIPPNDASILRKYGLDRELYHKKMMEDFE